MSAYLTILGSTGSVGRSTLEVVALHEQAFSVYALTANNNVTRMFEQCQRFQPAVAVMKCANAAAQLQSQLADIGITDIDVASGEQAICEVAQAPEVDSVMAAIVGAAGLLPTLKAVQTGKRVLIANKEPLVMTGALFMQCAQASGATILPIDSEHNAIFQCLPHDQSTADVKRIHLTASGGPFCGRVWQDLQNITPAQACAHPNWSMGQKISVDSATMMNKGLELIEATALFALPTEQVTIVVHPQSIIHSMVEYADGSLLAQLGAPDMRIPIAHALSWPKRIESGANTLDITAIAQLDFQPPDMPNLPCLRLARQASIAGGSAPAILNAANEVAVNAFLAEQIAFTDIAIVIEQVLQHDLPSQVNDLDDVLNIDNKARKVAHASIALLST